MSKNTSTQLTPAAGYKTKNMIFSEPVVGTIPNSTPPINYRRINISTKNSDGTVGDLILPTEELFSFGVSENKDPKTEEVNGHVLPLCLWDRDGATDEQKVWVETFNAIVEECKRHLVEHRAEIEQFDLEMSDLKKFNPMYWKKEGGQIVEGRGPTLYVKLIASKKHNRILSQFYDADYNEVDPLSLLGKYCYAKCAVRVERIFIGSKISLQIKLYEAQIRVVEMGMKSLLPRPKARGGMLAAAAANPMAADANNDDHSDPDSDDDGSLQNSSEEEKAPEPPKKVKKSKTPKKKVKKIKKKKVKKA